MTTLATATANAAVDAIVDRIDLGTLNAAGRLVLKATATTIATFIFDNPAANAASGGSATFAGLPNVATAVASGTVNNFEVQNRDAVVVFTGTVPGDLTLSNPTITIGQVINLTALAFAAA